MDRYIGLDAHSSSCTVAVIGPSGKRLQARVLETNAKVLINFIRTIPGNRHLCFEEGPQSSWLYEVLSPFVQEIVVVGVQKNRGSKSDKIDAFALAEMLRIGAVRTRIYKEQGAFGALRELCRAYNFLVADSVRVQNRIKSLFLSRGIPCSGRQVYATGRREEWIEKLPEKTQPLAVTLYLEYDAIEELRKKAEKAMLDEARKHPVYCLLKTVPGIGKIYAAQLLPIVVTPYRFSSKRSFWAYCGLAIVMRTSSDCCCSSVTLIIDLRGGHFTYLLKTACTGRTRLHRTALVADLMIPWAPPSLVQSIFQRLLAAQGKVYPYRAVVLVFCSRMYTRAPDGSSMGLPAPNITPMTTPSSCFPLPPAMLCRRMGGVVA